MNIEKPHPIGWGSEDIVRMLELSKLQGNPGGEAI
jgi:hypothetical protein